MNEQNIVCTPSISAVNNSTGGLALLWLSVEFSGLSDFSAYKTEMDSFAQFIRDECKLDPDIKYPASKLYETYRHYCQAIGRKPQSTAAFKKALDKLTGVYQSRTSSGMQWQGIKPVTQF